MSILDEKVSRKVKQYKTMITMKNKTEDELIEIAKRSVERAKVKSDGEFNFNLLFKKHEDVKLAQELLYKYLKDFSVETQADKNTLMHRIQLEIWHRHFSEKVEIAFHTGSGQTPLNLLNTIHKN